MKNLKFFILILIIFLIHSNVYGLEGKNIFLVSSDSVTSANTDIFKYDGISFSKTEEKGMFNFESITNNTDDKIPVSINILLFDSNKINIGFLTYCSEKDYSSDYAQFTLKGHESTSFNINVAKRYFVSEKSLSDLSYYAILDDNKYCQIGGYDKYMGLTFDEISEGMVSANKNKSDYEKIREMITNYHLNISKVLIITIIISIVSLFIRGLILNALDKRMYYETSILSYLPIGTSYMSVKLGFSDMLAKIFLLLYIISIPLTLIGIGIVILGVLSIFEVISFIIVLVKLISGNYNLLGSSSNNVVDDNQDNNSNLNNNENLLLDDDSSDVNVNLNYSNNSNSEFSTNDVQIGNKEEGSDLTNMFK